MLSRYLAVWGMDGDSAAHSSRDMAKLANTVDAVFQPGWAKCCQFSLVAQSWWLFVTPWTVVVWIKEKISAPLEFRST